MQYFVQYFVKRLEKVAAIITSSYNAIVSHSNAWRMKTTALSLLWLLLCGHFRKRLLTALESRLVSTVCAGTVYLIMGKWLQCRELSCAWLDLDDHTTDVVSERMSAPSTILLRRPLSNDRRKLSWLRPRWTLNTSVRLALEWYALGRLMFRHSS